MEKVRNDSTLDSHSSDEIDLIKLGLSIIAALQRGLKIIVIFVLIGACVGYRQYSTAVPIYSTSLVASSKVLANSQLEKVIAVVDKLAKEGNYTLLAKEFNISNQIAYTIKSIEAKGVTDATDNNVFEVTMLTSDYRVVDSVQPGLIHYLRQNDFVQKRIATQKQNLELMLVKVKEEQKRADSLRSSINATLSQSGNAKSMVLLFDPGSVNKDIMALYEKELKIRTDLLFIDDIQVIQGFIPFSAASRPNLIKTILITTGIAIVLALVLIAILEAWRGIKKFKEKTKTEQVVEGSAS